MTYRDIITELFGEDAKTIPGTKPHQAYVFLQGLVSGRNWTDIRKDYNLRQDTATIRRNYVARIIADLVDEAHSKREIRHILGIEREADDPERAHRIDRMIERYKK